MVNFSMKMASTVTVVTLLATTLSSSVVSAASEFLPYADLLATESIIRTQSTESGYRLGDTVTRAELAKVAANLGGYAPTACTGVFADVTSSLGDLCGYIEALEEAGVVASVNYFRPTASVTRAEMVKMLVGVVGETSSDVDAGYMDVSGLGDLAGYINRANEMGCAATATYFRPNASSSRGEAFKIAACVAGLEMTTPPPTGTGTTGTGVVVGSVSVALEGAAVAQYVPYNASSVKVGTIKLTAGAAATTVSSVVVTRSGLGLVTGISSLQLAQGGVAASDTRTMSTSSQTSTLKFTTPLVLAAGTSASYDILVNLNDATTANQNNQHQFTLTTVNVVGGTATGTPVTLGLLNTTSYSVGTVAVGTPSTGTMTSGKAAQTVVTTQITANRDATINGFTLTKSSGEDFTKVIANAKAYYNGAMIGTVTVTSDKITVTGLNIARLNGESANIEIKADGIYVGNTTIMTFGIDQSTDVSATEKSTGYIMGVVGAPVTASPSITITGVDLTMTKVSTGSKTVAPGTSNVELLNVNITSDATFDISQYALKLMSSATDLTNFVDDKVILYVNGNDTEITSSGASISTASGKVFTATADNFRVEPGTTVNVRVVGNVKTTASTGSTYKFNFALYQAKNVANGQTSTLSKSLDGDIITVNNGTFTVVKSPSTPTNKTAMEGSSTADLLWFDVRASAENQTLKSIKVTSSGAFDTYATKVALMQGGREIKSFTDSTNLALTAVTFDTLSESLVKDVSLPFSVRVTLKSGTVTTLGTSLKLSIAVPNTDVLVGRSVNTSTATTTSSTVVTGNSYQVSSNAPSVTLPAQSMKNTTVQFANASNYDVEVQSITYEMTRNAAANGSYVTWSGTALFLDAINGNNVGTTVGAIPGSVTTTFASGDLTIAAAPLDRFVELVDSANTVQDDQYTLTVKSMTYVYKDRTTSAVSSPITESYTVAK